MKSAARSSFPSFCRTLRESSIKAALATGPTQAIARTKALLNGAYDRGLADQAEQERLAQLENSAHPDFVEGIAAFLEKRPPVFTG